MRSLGYIFLGVIGLGIMSIAGCVGCVALVVGAAMRYDIDPAAVTRAHGQDIAAVSAWLQVDPVQRGAANWGPRVVGIMQAVPQDVGPDEYKAIWPPAQNFTKDGHYVSNGTGYADLTYNGNPLTVIVRSMTQGGTDYFILIDDPSLLVPKEEGN